MSNFLNFRLPPLVSAGNPVKAADHNAIIECLGSLRREIAANTLQNSSDIGTKRTAGGVTAWIKQPRGGGSSNVTICPFGKLVAWTEGEGESAVTKKGVSGGIITIGPHTWNVTRHKIEIGANGSWLLSIPIDFVANRDDDEEIILPGILSATRPEDDDWVQTPIAEEGTTDYPENEPADVSDGAGKIFIPIGTIEIEDGKLTFSKVACGNIAVSQCGGEPSHTRG